MKSDHVTLDQVMTWLTKIRSGIVRSGQVRAGQVKVRSGLVKVKVRSR